MKVTARRIVFPGIVILICIAIAAILMATKSEPETQSREKEPAFVTTQLVEPTPLTLYVDSQGLVTPRYETSLSAQVSGEIQQVSDVFLKGNIVSKGDMLAQVDPFDYEVNLEQARASLASANAAYILEQAQGRVAETERGKNNAVPSALALRKPQQEQALAAVKAAEAALDQAQKDLERTRIRAPYDAIVKTRTISPGTVINVGNVVGELIDVSVAEVRLPINQHDFQYLVGRGQNAKVILSTDNGEKTWQARIVRNEGIIDTDSRMAYLVAAIDKPYDTEAERLPFGSFVRAEIEGITLAKAVRLPRQIARDGQVPVVVDDRLTFKPVSAARYEGKHIIISGGLAAGDRVITSSLDHPIEGMAIRWREGDSDRPTAGIKDEDAR